MSLDLWSLLLSIPLAIIANIFTPMIQQWIKSIINKKSVKPQQNEVNELYTPDDVEIIKDRVINIIIFSAPYIIVIIGILLNIIENTILIILFILSFAPSIYIIINLIQRSIHVLRCKIENKTFEHKEIEKIKYSFITICIIYLPVIFISFENPNNNKYMILFFLSFSFTFYYVIRSIMFYIKALNNNKSSDFL